MTSIGTGASVFVLLAALVPVTTTSSTIKPSASVKSIVVVPPAVTVTSFF